MLLFLTVQDECLFTTVYSQALIFCVSTDILDWLLFNFIFNFSLPEEHSTISRMFPFHLKNESEYNVLYSYVEKKNGS